MLHIFNRKLKCLYTRLRWPIRRRSKRNVVIKKFGKINSKSTHDQASNNSAVIHPTSELNGSKKPEKPIRLATFNAALFSMAPVVPKTTEKSSSFDFDNDNFLKINNGITSQNLRAKSMNDRPKSILKQSPLHPSSINTSDAGAISKQQKFAKSKLRVSINLPDNEISLKKSGQLSFPGNENGGNTERNTKGKGPLRFSMSMSPSVAATTHSVDGRSFRSTKTVFEVLRELNADILALQDVKAEEEKAMKPLSDLASSLGMHYVFAESWAPEYGNAILSKWPIKKWKVQKIFDDSDFRNVLKATIDVPELGEIEFYCTLLDHLDENWRKKQINAIIQSTDTPHILAGGLNSLDETDYSPERWTDIVKYYEDMGKPTPKVEVMKHLKSKQYSDAKDFAGECESVVMIAKGQSVQGTCKYGTRVDYILSSSNSPYKFVPGSYSVLSSKGTSDHHIVKVDMLKTKINSQEFVNGKMGQQRQRVIKLKNSSTTKGIWKA